MEVAAPRLDRPEGVDVVEPDQEGPVAASGEADERATTDHLRGFDEVCLCQPCQHEMKSIDRVDADNSPFALEAHLRLLAAVRVRLTKPADEVIRLLLHCRKRRRRDDAPKFIVGNVAPPFLHMTPYLLPVAFKNVFIHDVKLPLCHGGFMEPLKSSFNHSKCTCHSAMALSFCIVDTKSKLRARW